MNRVGVALAVAMLCASIALNVALLSGGRLADAASETYTAWAGTPSAAARQAALVAEAEAALEAKTAEVQVLYAKVAELSNMLLLARETNRNIRDRYVVLSGELDALKASSNASPQ